MIEHAATNDTRDARGSATAKRELPSPRGLRTWTWSSIGMVVLIFVAGGICGAAAARLALIPAPLTSLDQIPGRVADRMQRDLGLSETQHGRLEQIGLAHQAELQRIRAKIAPQMRSELRRIIDEMAEVLTPEQSDRWKKDAERRVDSLVPASEGANGEPASN